MALRKKPDGFGSSVVRLLPRDRAKWRRERELSEKFAHYVRPNAQLLLVRDLTANWLTP
jgi:hypothetical protein